MSDPVEFKYINNSLTTTAQSKVVNKLASHFKIPVKNLREALDKEQLQNGVISVDETVCYVESDFYVASFDLNVVDLIHPTKFENSKLYYNYTIMKSRASYTPHQLLTIVDDTDIFILVDIDRLREFVGVGGLYWNYSNCRNALLVPFKTFLDTEYPVKV
jgi:hypothetical protein